MTKKPLATIGGALMLAGALAVPAAAQLLKPWKHGVIEPKGDAGFQWMVGQRDFAAKHGLKLEIISLKNGAIAHKALLSGDARQHRIESGRRVSSPVRTAPTSRSSAATGRACRTG